MRKLIYSMMVSLDGYIARPNGELDWVPIDEVGLFVNPVVLGAGKPMFSGGELAGLRLLETRTFGSRVVYLRYERTDLNGPG